MLAAVRSTPDRPAVVEFVGDGISTTTYRQLASRVSDYAAVFNECGYGIGDRVVLESDTSASAIAMFLACASLGMPFIPVSPETPAQRLHSIIGTTEPALYLLDIHGDREGIPPHVGTGRFGPDGLEPDRPPRRCDRPRREIVQTDPAYMIFTSGTTGRPKGVVMSHRAVVSFYRGMLSQGIVNESDRVASTSPLQFDFSLLDIGLALGSGAAVVPVPRTLLRWPTRFVRVLSDTGATQVNGVPSIWRAALRHTPQRLAALDRIHGILFCGENFPLHELRQLQQLLPHARITNCYGSTESMACSFADVPNPLPDDIERLSIGRAHPGAEMMLVDDSGMPIEAHGEVGEIYLRSPALFTGYWDDPDATRTALVPDPMDHRTGQSVLRTGDLAYCDDRGQFYLCGRVDSQVQIRGNRVELGEVERRLLEFPGIAAAAAVIMREGSAAEPELAALVVPSADAQQVDDTDLGSFCMAALPEYMVPRRVEVVPNLPLNENGKIDRAAISARYG
jgi:amino acid adenylation domain-containing protein